jgi:glycosyltransferase involved in cell wall biosynthesis
MPWVELIFGSVAQSEGVLLALGVHGLPNGFHWTDRLARRTQPDVAICVSRFLAAEVAKIYPSLPTEVVYNPVAPVRPLSQSERIAVRTEANTPPDALVIIQAGRIEPGKGHGVCLEALGLLRDYSGWECWQVGGVQRPAEVAYFQGLRQQAARLGIADRVRFWGQRSDVTRLLAAADIYCQPNDTVPEGFGNSFVEALGAGLPVVASAMGGATEIVDETCGFLLPSGDVGAVAATLEKLISDAALRTKLGAGGPPRAHTLSGPDLQIPRLYEALGKALERKRVPTES